MQTARNPCLLNEVMNLPATFHLYQIAGSYVPARLRKVGVPPLAGCGLHLRSSGSKSTPTTHPLSLPGASLPQLPTLLFLAAFQLPVNHFQEPPTPGSQYKTKAFWRPTWFSSGDSPGDQEKEQFEQPHLWSSLLGSTGLLQELGGANTEGFLSGCSWPWA